MNKYTFTLKGSRTDSEGGIRNFSVAVMERVTDEQLRLIAKYGSVGGKTISLPMFLDGFPLTFEIRVDDE